MKHMEDKRLCPHCGKAVHERPYLMSRLATENVLSATQILWIVAAVLALLILTNASS